jgi:predicted nucleic acid-binding protein
MSDRAVFDCVVYLQAVINESGPAFACFRLVDDSRVTVCVSAAVLAEARDVLSRPDLQAKFRRLTPERVEAFLSECRGQLRKFARHTARPGRRGTRTSVPV